MKQIKVVFHWLSISQGNSPALNFEEYTNLVITIIMIIVK